MARPGYRPQYLCSAALASGYSDGGKGCEKGSLVLRKIWSLGTNSGRLHRSLSLLLTVSDNVI
eukprot:1157067-Pelagomonas_calceolata.AAC.1